MITLPLYRIAENFLFPGEIRSVLEYGTGKINDTFLVTTAKGHFILQRLNSEAFRHPELLMHNLRIIGEHIENRLAKEAAIGQQRWEVPKPLPTIAGSDIFHDSEGQFWRALSFIDNAQAFETIENHKHAWQVGWALGRFHRLLSDLPPEKLHDTLPGFHITPLYLEKLDLAVAAPLRQTISDETEQHLEFIANRRDGIYVLENALLRGEIFLKIMHGDPKVSNVMIDSSTANAVGFVDLDTVKPGLIHYDIGDCLRSCCNTAGDDAPVEAAIDFDTDICQIMLQGYMKEAVYFVSPHDTEFFYDAIRLIPFELGIRFLSDYLTGDIYFKTEYPEQNLHRAKIQFKLCRSIEKQEEKIRKIIRDFS